MKNPDKTVLLNAYEFMRTARHMSDLFEEKTNITSKYVHACSRGHEALQVALGMQLKKQDFLSAYYRDDSILLSIGFTPFELMLQLLAKKDDPFSGGRAYYSHPSSIREDMPKIPHQSSATGMQAIPTTGIAMGIKFLENSGNSTFKGNDKPLVVCSLGDAAITEGEVSEAFQMAVLHQFPIIYFVQDNEWDISAHSEETRAMDAAVFAKGFTGLEVRDIDGSNFIESYNTLKEVFKIVRAERRPFLVHARVPLLGHHTSGVRKEWYRHDLEDHAKRDPVPKFRKQLLKMNFGEKILKKIDDKTSKTVRSDFDRAMNSKDPLPEDLYKFDFAPTPVTKEKGIREPKNGEVVLMVDAGVHAIKEILDKHPESLVYGQDVGMRLGGVFREAALLAKKFGESRVFNTPIQEAFIVGSTVGMSAAGCRPIVEIQFADYIWPSLNQLFTEVSRSYYLSNGKWPVHSVIRVPTGAYGRGGPYHSSSVESVLLNIKGIKIAYPSNAADLKGLLKSAFYDPNPVVVFEHKGLYWSKVKGTEGAKTIEPDADYILPMGMGKIVLEADKKERKLGNTMTVITYGMGVYWAKNAAKKFPGQVEVVDLRTLHPLDEEMIFTSVNTHSKCLVLTEEPVLNTFGQALAGRISKECWENLDVPVEVLGSENLPAIPLNYTLEQTMIPSAEKVAKVMGNMLNN